MEVKLSVLRARLTLPQENSWYTFLLRLIQTWVYSVAGRIRSIEKSSDNRWSIIIKSTMVEHKEQSDTTAAKKSQTKQTPWP
jgi:hypothetical protein